MWKAFKTMLKIELRLSIRDMNMVIFAICMPVVVMFLLGSINDSKEGIAQAFSSVSTIGICAGGVMGLPIVVADYRQKKILKRLKVTPISPSLILVVHVVIYAIYAIVSLLLVFGIASVFYKFQLEGSWITFLGSFILVMLSMFSIGLLVGGIAPNIKIASVIASLLYFPMLIFSGATVPYNIFGSGIQTFANVMPLTQGIKMLEASALGLPMQDVLFSILTMGILGVICTSIAVIFFKWE